MRAEMRAHRLVLIFVAGWIAIFLYVLFASGVHRSEARVEAEAILLLTNLVAGAFVYVGMGEIVAAATFAPPHRREFTAYLLLGEIALITGFAVLFNATASLRTVAIIVAPYPILFGLAELRMARGLAHHRRQATALYVCGVLELASGVVLATGHSWNDVQLLRLLTITAIASLLQLLPFVFFRPNQLPRGSS